MTTGAKGVDQVRERVLEAACELFTRRGINSTGVDLVSEVAGVSKRSLYQRFPSKDHLIAAYLPRATDRFLEAVLPSEGDTTPPAGRLVAVFDTARRASADPDFRGCPVLNAAAELLDPEHPVRGVALGYKQRMEAYFTELAAAAGAVDAALLAEQLVVVFDGAMAYAAVRRTAFPESVCRTVRTLLATQGLEPVAGTTEEPAKPHRPEEVAAVSA
ncbi:MULTISPECIES: TetR/AcrR family transcriptional regulator [unclassified Streptomyces]|uniref:TetR/AcrR family transcriptional regulator n=1 Tax=unclassified Streptomyces TaxID=2593676 RepID=UPI0037FADAFE